MFALGAILMLGVAPRATTAAGSADLQVRVFDIRPLVTASRIESAPPLGMFPLHAPWFRPYDFVDLAVEEGEPERVRAFEPDEIFQLVEAFVETLAPGSWDESGSIREVSSTLVVRHTPEMLDRVADLLAALERWCHVRIPVRAYLFAGPEPPRAPGTLSEAECRDLLAGEAAGRIQAEFSSLAAPGRRSTLGQVRERSYVSDYSVEVAQSARIAEPVVRVLRHGALVEVVPYLLEGGNLVLDVAASVVRPDLPLRRERTDAEAVGDIELPSMEAVRLGFRAPVANGGGVLAGVRADGASPPVWVLVTAGPVAKPSLRAEWGDGRIGLFPVGFLTAARGGFAPRVADLTAMQGRYRARAAWSDPFEEDESAGNPFVALDDIVAGLEELGGSGEAGRARVLVARDTLLVTGSETGLALVGRYIESLEELHARSIEAEAAVLRVPIVAWNALRSSLAGPGPWTMPRARAEALLGGPARASGGSGLATTTMQGVASAGFSGIERAVLSDYSVEIAQDSAIADPEVVSTAAGFALQVRPMIDIAGDRVALSLEGELTRLEVARAESFGAPNIGRIDGVERDSVRIRVEPVLSPGETWLDLVARDSEGGFAWVLVVRARVAPSVAHAPSDR
jgi:hypothetical protein